jgi:hypothetical protein
MPAERFCAYLPRIAVYGGAVAWALRQEHEPAPTQPPPRPTGPMAVPDPASSPLFGPLQAAGQLAPVIEVG